MASRDCLSARRIVPPVVRLREVGQGIMACVFISYSKADGDFAENLKSRVEKAGFDTWMYEDKLRAGDDWREEIDQAIREAFALVWVPGKIA